MCSIKIILKKIVFKLKHPFYVSTIGEDWYQQSADENIGKLKHKSELPLFFLPVLCKIYVVRC